MLQIDVSVSQWKERTTEEVIRRAVGRAVREAGHFVTAESKLRAPISPKQSQGPYRTRKSSLKLESTAVSEVMTRHLVRTSVSYKAFGTSALGKKYGGSDWRKTAGKARGKMKFRESRQKRNPGGLTRSIRVEFQGDEAAHVFVPTNSEAGKYARYIHDLRYVKWSELGPGSEAKASGGKPVGEKFIARAYSENVDKVRRIFDTHIERALGTSGGTPGTP